MDKDDFIISDYLEHYNSSEPCRLTRKQDRLQEPFIFFGKKIHDLMNKQTRVDSIIYYQYVAFNEGIVRKTAKFNNLVIYQEHSHHIGGPERIYLINPEPRVTLLSDPDFSIIKIPRDALIELIKFIDQERKKYQSFCKTIYDAVIEELHLRDGNTETSFFREINKKHYFEKKINLINKSHQSYYRQILDSINIIEKELLSTNSNQQQSGPNGFSFPAPRKNSMNKQLTELLRQKEDIESRFSAYTT